MSPMISNGQSGSARLHAVAVLGLVATLTAQLVLSIVIKGSSYGEMDGEAAQAAILTAFRFAGIFDVSNINPLQGIGSQLFPLNVWVNPATGRLLFSIVIWRRISPPPPRWRA